jgi:YHS domain-containing protein
MKRWILSMGLVSGAALYVGGTPAASACDCCGKAKKAETGERAGLPKCPISGEPIDFRVSLKTDEGPVFFCSPDCIRKYESDPQKYATAAASQRKVLSDRPHVQVACPVSGAPVDPKVFIEQDGQKVYFCSEDCITKFKAEPAQYRSNLASSYSYQTKCPVMGGEINPQVFTKLPNGQRVFFCCPGCGPKFLANPAEYAPQLAAQGIKIDAEAATARAKEPPSAGETPDSHTAGPHDHGH